MSGAQPDHLPWVLSSSPPFQPIPLAPALDGDMGRGAAGSGGHPALVSEATWSPEGTETFQDPGSRAKSHP